MIMIYAKVEAGMLKNNDAATAQKFRIIYSAIPFSEMRKIINSVKTIDYRTPLPYKLLFLSVKTLPRVMSSS